MLDYMYDGLPEQEQRAVSEEGRALFANIAQNAEATHAVRERRTILAQMIDSVASRLARPRVLSIACGHLREAGKSRAVEQGHVSELVALDQDAESLREIGRSAYGACVKPVKASILALLRGRVSLGSFDLIYSAGLYDYLDQRLARALTTRLFSMLNPGGRLLIGNFAQGVRDGAFMEAFMDWSLVLRTPLGMRELFAGVPSAELTLRVCEDSLRNVLYADATRKL
jgi:extracellular factor (EF) 3-hydroxypalmitic acid methyl ester biosynthesis protein